jgi:hypothetical protein
MGCDGKTGNSDFTDFLQPVYTSMTHDLIHGGMVKLTSPLSEQLTHKKGETP